jgi:hypothetical protein
MPTLKVADENLVQISPLKAFTDEETMRLRAQA